LSLEEKPALGFVAEANPLRGGRGNFPADQLAIAVTDAPTEPTIAAARTSGSIGHLVE
jgi:hypothetical protein